MRWESHNSVRKWNNRAQSTDNFFVGLVIKDGYCCHVFDLCCNALQTGKYSKLKLHTTRRNYLPGFLINFFLLYLTLFLIFFCSKINTDLSQLCIISCANFFMFSWSRCQSKLLVQKIFYLIGNIYLFLLSANCEGFSVISLFYIVCGQIRIKIKTLKWAHVLLLTKRSVLVPWKNECSG